MENCPTKYVVVRAMMHGNMFDDENVDLNQVMNDVYVNLDSFYEVLLRSNFYMRDADLEMMIKPVGIVCNTLITFFRCTFKWCITEDGAINKNLVNTLVDVESHLLAASDLILSCARVLSDKKSWPPKQCFENLLIIDHLVPKIAEVYPVVFTAPSSPFIFCTGEASVVRFFNQAWSVMYYYFFHEQREGHTIFTLSDNLFFVREYFLFVKDSMSRENCDEFFICLEAILDKVACYTFLRYFCNTSQQYLHVEDIVLSEMRTGTLKALVLLPDSCPVFTDKLLENYLDCVQQNLIHLLKDDINDLTVFVKNQVQFLYDELGYLVHRLVNYQTDSRYKQEMLSVVRIRLQVGMRDIGSVIYAYVVNREMKRNVESEMALELSDLPQEVRVTGILIDMYISQTAFINRKTYKIEVAPVQPLSPVTGNEDSMHVLFQNAVRISDDSNDTGHVMSHALVPSIDIFVGFEDEVDLIREQLAGDLSKLDVVSVIGMAGLGKTTLAKKVYEDPCIVERFDVRSWCIVSQEYNKRELLLNILGSIVEPAGINSEMDDEDLSLAVYKKLKGKRYLIVLDDVWGMEVYEDIKQLFPDDDCGSRLMLTSRNKSISLQAKHHCDPLELRFLTDDESWDLLAQKVYPREKCPLELCEVGKKVAQKCGGLPLAVVLVAGVLSKSEKKKDFWEQVAQSLISHIAAGDSERPGMAAFELSYKLLPDYLKPFFLYVGAFPEDRQIPATKLIWLWIAEGFVKSTDEIRSLEEQAEINLRDLIDRSLVIVAERRSNGRVKSCRVHDILRDMCLVKAIEESFLQQVHASSKLADCVIYQPRLSINARDSYEDEIILLQGEEDPSIPSFHTISVTPSLHSFLFFDKKASSLGKWEEAIKSVLCNFKLLKILHFENTDFDETLCSDITRLVDLRYISIQATVIPPEISGLCNLEALIVKGARGEVIVPHTIWEMVNLRHLHIDGRAFFELPEHSSKLENLVTLSTPALEGNETELVSLVPSLRKLRCIFLDPPSGNEFPNLSSLHQLESLKVLYHGSVPCSGLFNLPSSLKKLSLSKFNLQWEEVSSFQNLPNLEVLKLRVRAANGESWDMKEDDGGFPKLRFMKLEGLNVKQWSAFANLFPCLEKLVLQRCKQLMNLPDLGDFYSLQKIEVLWCNSYVANFVKLVKEEQEVLKVYIYPPVDSSSDQGQVPPMDLRYIYITRHFRNVALGVSQTTMMRLVSTYEFTEREREGERKRGFYGSFKIFLHQTETSVINTTMQFYLHNV